MARPACAMPAVTAALARGLAVACGIGLAATLPQVLGDGPAVWPNWSRAALAQTLSTEPSALKRLAESLPYRPEEPGSGRLSEADLARAVGVIADLEIFFATLTQSDADSQAGPVWRDSEAAYGAAATTLETALRNGLFRIVVTEGGKFALVRRGDEVWVDSDLAGAWNMERVRRARQEGDDWPDVAALAALLFDHWRIRNVAGTAWMGLQLDRLDVSRAELERGGPVAAAVFTRYGFLKDIYFQAVLLATVTAGSENATLWDARAASIRQDIDTLLRSLATTGLGGDLPTKLRDGWAEYRARIEETSVERGALIVAAPEPDPALARIGAVPPKPEQEPRPHIGREAAGEETAPERTAPATETGLADAAQARQTRPANAGAREQDYIALLLARTADAVRAAEEAKRQADAANLAADDARAAMSAAQGDAEGRAEDIERLRQEAADLAAQLEQATGEQAALTERLAEAEDRASAAEAAAAEAETARQSADAQVAELGAQLAAAQSDAAGSDAETARLRQEAADLAGQLDQADSAQAALAAQLAEAEAARQSADAQVAELGAQLAAAQSDAAGSDAETARLRQEAADLAAQLADARTRASAAEASAEAAAAEAGQRIAALQEQLAARDADLGRAETQAASQASALAAARAELGRLQRQNAALQGATAEADSAKAALATAQEEARTEAARAARAEAAAAASEEATSAARQDLANREVELESLRAELRALRQEVQASDLSATAETASTPSRASAWRTDWLAPVLAAVLLAGGLAALLAVSRRRQHGRAPATQAGEEAGEEAAETPLAAAAEPRPLPATEPASAPVEPIGAATTQRPAGDRTTPAIPATSASIVEAVRRQDWASADAQFSQLSGVSSPGLKDLLADPSGELLALACRAADLDRLTFAALYLLQGQGRAVADPAVVAGAMGLFERTGPAEAQRRLAERRDSGSLSA